MSDTPQQKAILRQCRAARIVRRRFPAGVRVWSVGGTPPKRLVQGTVLRHLPMTNAQGGMLVVAWDTGRTGNIGPAVVELA